MDVDADANANADADADVNAGGSALALLDFVLASLKGNNFAKLGLAEKKFVFTYFCTNATYKISIS